jgi:hypothetical protein
VSDPWPEFTNEPIYGDRTWSATFDSYDQRNEDCYYVITLSDGTAFMAQVSATFSTDQWIESEVTATLRARLGQVAETGKSNTTYRGPVMRLRALSARSRGARC